MKVNILLSTYNGEQFLREQIESIRQQTFTTWNLLIRDDGSSDETLAIIADYQARDERIRLIDEKSPQNLGVIKSFHRLLTHEIADYYFFCDQDDIWLEDKLTLCLEKAKSYKSTCPLLIYTDLTVVDQSLTVIYESMIKTQSHHPNTKLCQELTENTVTGGTAMINHALAKLWTVTDKIIMHDWYLALLASACGKLVFLDQTTELYRQHNNNVLGARTWSKRIKGWLKPQQLVAKYWHLITISQEQAKHLLTLELSKKDRELVLDFVGLMDKPLFERIQVLKRHHLRKNRWLHTVVFRSLIITKFGYRRK